MARPAVGAEHVTIAPSADVRACAERFRLVVPERLGRGSAGERLGHGSGSSLEYQDRRAYVVGDDVRHLDWRALARTDQPMIRVYREEILPRLDVLLDASASMATSSDKQQTALDLAVLFVEIAGGAGLAARMLLLGDRVEERPAAVAARAECTFNSRVPLDEAVRRAEPLLRAGAMRIIISDFLSPFDAAHLAKRLGAQAGSLCCLQILSADDVEPPAGLPLRLTDSETGETADLILDDRTVDAYRERLARLSAELSAGARRVGGMYVKVIAGRALERVCSEDLATAGVIQ